MSSVQQITGVKEKAQRPHSETVSFCCGKQPQMQMLIRLNKPWRNCWKLEQIQKICRSARAFQEDNARVFWIHQVAGDSTELAENALAIL